MLRGRLLRRRSEARTDSDEGARHAVEGDKIETVVSPSVDQIDRFGCVVWCAVTVRRKLPVLWKKKERKEGHRQREAGRARASCGAQSNRVVAIPWRQRFLGWPISGQAWCACMCARWRWRPTDRPTSVGTFEVRSSKIEPRRASDALLGNVSANDNRHTRAHTRWNDGTVCWNSGWARRSGSEAVEFDVNWHPFGPPGRFRFAGLVPSLNQSIDY